MESASTTTRMKRAYNITFIVLTLATIMGSIWVLGWLILFGWPLQPIFLMGTALLVWLPGVRVSKVYLIFVVFPLAWLTSAALTWTSILLLTPLPWPVNLELNLQSGIIAAAIDIGSGLLTIAGLSFLATAMALRTFLAKKSKTPLLYVTVVLIPLGISTVLIFLMAPGAVILAPGFLIVLSPMLGTVLIGTLEYPVQHIVVGILVLVMIIVVGGWARMRMIDDGLDAFTGQERVEAEQALRLWDCFGGYFDGRPSPPPVLRVVKGDGGEFRVLGYTWWGLPSGQRSCGVYRQWNRW